MPKTRKLTLLFVAGDTQVVSDKPRSKDEVAMSTGIDPATLTTPVTAMSVIDVSDDEPVPAAISKEPEPPARDHGDTPYQKRFARKPFSTTDRSLIGSRKTSRFRKQEVATAIEPRSDGPVPGANPLLERK
jgi:hypothetical protein